MPSPIMASPARLACSTRRLASRISAPHWNCSIVSDKTLPMLLARPRCVEIRSARAACFPSRPKVASSRFSNCPRFSARCTLKATTKFGSGVTSCAAKAPMPQARRNSWRNGSRRTSSSVKSSASQQTPPFSLREKIRKTLVSCCHHSRSYSTLASCSAGETTRPAVFCGVMGIMAVPTPPVAREKRSSASGHSAESMAAWYKRSIVSSASRLSAIT